MSKTPKTMIEDFLDVSKTQTVKLGRHGAGQRLVRTPEPSSSTRRQTVSRLSRTPQPYMNHSASKSIPKHDRVSSLRGKRRSSISSGLDVMETPRHLLEGFLEGTDSTAPLTRYASRVPERVGASQPAIPMNRRSSQYRGTESMMELDIDTPRTMLQRFVTNTVDTVDTPGPVFRRETEEILVSPQIPLVPDTYSTPSPFKASSIGSDQVSVSSHLSTRRTPRSARSKRAQFTFNNTGQDLFDESVIPPTNPTDYQEPSFLQSTSSDDESYVPETQHTMVSHRSLTTRGKFNLTMPPEIVEEQSRYNQQRSLHQSRENVIDRDSTRLSEHHSMRQTDRRSGGQYEDFEISRQGERSDRRSMGPADHPSYRQADLNNSRHSTNIVYDSEGERYRNDGQEMDIDQPEGQLLPSDGVYKEYTLPMKDYNASAARYGDNDQNYDNDDRRNSVSRHSHTSEEIQDYRNRSLDEEPGVRQERGAGGTNAGRWSVGHRSRFESPSNMIDDGRSRLSEGYHRQMLDDRYLSHRDNNDDSKYRENLQERRYEDVTSSRRSRLSVGNESITSGRHEDLTPSRRSRPSTGPTPKHHTTTGNNLSHTEDHHVNDMSAEEIYYAQKLEMSRRGPLENVHTFGNISETFSPRITSTQRRQSVSMAMEEGDQDHIEAVTPSPNVSPGFSPRRTPQSTPRNSSQNASLQGSSTDRRSENRSSLDLTLSTTRRPLRPLTPNNQASPQPSVRSSGSRSSNRSRSSLQRMSSRRSRSDNVTGASPSVAGSGRRGLSETLMPLPNATINFSPQVNSTQNMAATSQRDHLQDTSQDHVENTSHHEGIPNDNEWQDVQEQIEDVDEQPKDDLSVQKTSTPDQQPKKKVVRKPRKKSKQYTMPTSVVKKHFTHYAGMRVDSEAIDMVMQVSERYWDNLAADLSAYAQHGKRKQINMSDFILLFRRQGHTTDKLSLKILIERYLPMEEREKLIPMARAGGRIEPELSPFVII